MSAYTLTLEDARRDRFSITWTFTVSTHNGYEDRWIVTTGERPRVLFDAQALGSGYIAPFPPRVADGATTGDPELDQALISRCREEIARVKLARVLTEPAERRFT